MGKKTLGAQSWRHYSIVEGHRGRDHWSGKIGKRTGSQASSAEFRAAGGLVRGGFVGWRVTTDYWCCKTKNGADLRGMVRGGGAESGSGKGGGGGA